MNVKTVCGYIIAYYIKKNQNFVKDIYLLRKNGKGV